MDETRLFTALQHADSFFPSGAMAFSWGLEGLRGDGRVTTPDEVAGFLEGQILGRWASCDRPFLVAAHRAADRPERVASLDRRLASMTLPQELRAGAARAGAALLGVHERLGTPGAASYRALVRSRAAPGHLPVVQGLLFRGVGFSEAEGAAIAAYLVSAGGLSAALRLGLVNHVEAQKTLMRLRAVAATVLAEPPPSIDDAHMFAPGVEIAAARHEIQETRLFAN
jgi:urease accessory protein